MADEPVSLETRLVAIEGKIDRVFESAEKTRKYILWTGLITAAVIILPLLAVPLVLPLFQTYINTLTLPGGY